MALTLLMSSDGGTTVRGDMVPSQSRGPKANECGFVADPAGVIALTHARVKMKPKGGCFR